MNCELLRPVFLSAVGFSRRDFPSLRSPGPLSLGLLLRGVVLGSLRFSDRAWMPEVGLAFPVQGGLFPDQLEQSRDHQHLVTWCLSSIVLAVEI